MMSTYQWKFLSLEDIFQNSIVIGVFVISNKGVSWKAYQ